MTFRQLTDIWNAYIDDWWNTLDIWPEKPIKKTKQNKNKNKEKTKTETGTE